MPSKLGISIVAAIALAASTAFAQQKREVTIALASTSFATAVPRLAQEMGLFDKHGLTAKFTVLDSASAATSALIGKSVEFAVSGAGEIVSAQAKGQKVVALANAYAGLGGSVVLAKSVADKLGVSPTAPAKDRLKALNGVLIGGPSPTGAYTVALRTAVASAGSEVRFAYMAAPAAVAALETGAIEGYIAGAPFWATPVASGKATLWLSGPKGEFPAEAIPATTGTLQTMREFAEANPDVIKRVVAVFSDLGKAVEQRPDDVKAAVAKLYPTVDKPTLDLLFAAESVAWKDKLLTVNDMIRDIAFAKALGGSVADIDKVDPKTMIFP